MIKAVGCYRQGRVALVTVSFLLLILILILILWPDTLREEQD